jgi:hypothetical protein
LFYLNLTVTPLLPSYDYQQGFCFLFFVPVFKWNSFFFFFFFLDTISLAALELTV